MIIGNGDVASAIVDKENRLYFASGVSNSGEARESEYQREIDLLMSQDRSRHIVYFGSLCIFYNDSRYTQHKKYMEELVRQNFEHYTIVRLGLIDWGKNPNTLINFLRNRYANGLKLEIRNVIRYVLNKEEFRHWLNLIPDWNCEMNVTGQPMTVTQIVEKYVYPRLYDK